MGVHDSVVESYDHWEDADLREEKIVLPAGTYGLHVGPCGSLDYAPGCAPWEDLGIEI